MCKLIEENSSVSMSHMEYKKKYEALEQNYNENRIVLESLLTKKSDLDARKTEMTIFIESFQKAPNVISKWDQMLRSLFVKKAKVEHEGKINIKSKYQLFKTKTYFKFT